MAESVRDRKGIHQNLVDKCKICGGIVDLKVCAKCKQVAYCSREHQRQDWKFHKDFCKKNTSASPATDTAKSNDSSKLMPTHMVDVTKQLGGLSIDSQDEVSEVTSGNERVEIDDTSLQLQQTRQRDQTSPMRTLFVNNGDSETCTIGSEESTNISTSRREKNQNLENITVNNLKRPLDEKSYTSSNISNSDLKSQNIESGSSEKFILESEENSLQAPDYKAKEAESQASSNMPYLTVVESRNKALSEYVCKCLNAYGVCVIDNFLGNDKGTDILDEVHDMYDGGELSSGQLVNAQSPKGAVRGDVITWVDGSEMGCANINFLISSIDAIMLHCQRSLGHYNIKGRSKVLISDILYKQML